MSSKQRIFLVQKAVACLVDKHGLWPSSEQKTMLAKNIVDTWPVTKDTTPMMAGHEHFYSAKTGTGFIQSRLKNVRQATGEKLRKTSKCKTSEEQQTKEGTMETNDIVIEDVQEKIDWMKYQTPSHATMAKHVAYFKDTFQYRRGFIRNTDHTITDVFNEFPRFHDIDALISLDFSLMFGEEDKLVKKWTSLKDKIIKIGHDSESPAVQCLLKTFEGFDTDLCALSVIIFLLHRPMAKKGQGCSRADGVRHLVHNVPEGTHVEEAIATIKSEGKRQPLMLTLGPQNKPNQFWLCLDNMAVPGGRSIVEAFDKLFKSYYVFGIDYPSVLKSFYEYFAAFVYEVCQAATVKPTVRAFASAVNAVV